VPEHVPEPVPEPVPETVPETVPEPVKTSSKFVSGELTNFTMKEMLDIYQDVDADPNKDMLKISGDEFGVPKKRASSRSNRSKSNNRSKSKNINKKKYFF